MNRSKKLRKAVRKLDFVEDAARARSHSTPGVISESEEETVTSSDSQDNKDVTNSPILYRKLSSRRHIPETPSPVERKRLKVDDEPQPSTSTFGSDNNPTKIHEPSYEIEDDDESSHEEYVIDDSSPEVSNDGTISSASTSCPTVSVLRPRDTSSAEFVMRTPVKNEVTEENCDSGMKRKRPKKGGFVERLIKLRKIKLSEKRIREHQRKIMKMKENWRRNFYVVDAWNDADRLTLKCLQLDVSEDGSLTNSASTDFVYVILNPVIGKCFKMIKQGTCFRIAAPWREARPPTLNATVLVAVNFLELIDGIPDVTVPETELRELPVEPFREEEPLLFDKMFESARTSFFR